MPSVAYVLKGFPRLSETFIASEIHRVERAGVPLRLYVIKPVEPWERGPVHPVVERIRARPEYLPGVESVSGVPLRRWLPRNVGPFLPALRRLARERPRGLARATAAALAQGVRGRKGRISGFRRVNVKELLQAAALADRLRDAPDVRHLHAHFAHGTTTVTWLASIITGQPFSFTGHAKDIYAESLNPAGLLRRKLLAAEFAITCTEANVRHLREVAPEATVHRIYHGLNADIARLLDGAAPSPRGNGRLRLLGVGRLVEKKGFDVLVEACKILDRRGVPFEAAIVGQDGDHGALLRERIHRLGLDGRVTLPGAAGQEQLYEEYRHASAVCLPCRLLAEDRDGIPNVLVEAMACGAPVVSTGVSGIPELVADGENGLLVPPDDPDALAEALIRLHEDPALAERLARAGEETVRERFDGDRLARRLAALFEAVTA